MIDKFKNNFPKIFLIYLFKNVFKKNLIKRKNKK